MHKKSTLVLNGLREPLELTAENVEKVFADCSFRVEEIEGGQPVVQPKMVQGIESRFGFHPDRLMGHREKITELVDQVAALDKGACHYAELCVRKDGFRWAVIDHANGDYTRKDVEHLIALGIGTEVLQYKNFWQMIPSIHPAMQVVSSSVPQIMRAPDRTFEIETELNQNPYSYQQ